MLPLGRRTRTFTIWLLCAALTASALLPSLSHALARVAGIDSVEICTSTGIARPVAGGAQGEGARELPADDDARTSGACAWCLAQAGCVALPPPERPFDGVVPRTADAPVRMHVDSPHRVRLVSNARPRAPPR